MTNLNSLQGKTAKFTNVLLFAVCESMMRVESVCEIVLGGCVVCMVI